MMSMLMCVFVDVDASNWIGANKGMLFICWRMRGRVGGVVY